MIEPQILFSVRPFRRRMTWGARLFVLSLFLLLAASVVGVGYGLGVLR